MSELKARLLGQTMNEYGCDTKIYLKSEADKVIAELEMKLAIAQQVLRLNKPEALYSNLETMSRLTHEKYVIERRERHHKYKRCEAMAEWCNSEMGRETFACFRPRHTKEVWREEHKYWAKWRKIWFELYKKIKT